MHNQALTGRLSMSILYLHHVSFHKGCEQPVNQATEYQPQHNQGCNPHRDTTLFRHFFHSHTAQMDCHNRNHHHSKDMNEKKNNFHFPEMHIQTLTQPVLSFLTLCNLNLSMR